MTAKILEAETLLTELHEKCCVEYRKHSRYSSGCRECPCFMNDGGCYLEEVMKILDIE